MHMKPYGVVILVSIRLCAVSLAQSFYDHQADKQNTATWENEKQPEPYNVCEQIRQAPEKIKVFRLKNLNGKTIFNPSPEYPIAAKEQKITGQVVVEVFVDIQEGTVRSWRMKSGPPLLRAAVAKSVCKVKFPPAIIEGKLLIGVGQLKYDFRLP